MSNKLIEKLYFGFLLLLPLVFSSSIIDPVLAPRQIALTVFVLLLTIVLIVEKKTLVFNFKTPVVYASIGFLVLNFISFFQADVSSESHVLFSKLTLLFSFFVITAVLLYNDLIRLNKLILALVLFGLVTLGFSFSNIIEKTMEGQHLLRQIEMVKGSSANKNLLASVLFLCLPFFCMGLQQQKTVRFLSLFGIVSTLFVLITIRTRIVLIACLLFFLLLVCYKIKRQFSISKRYFLLGGLVFIGVALMSYKLYFENTTAQIPGTAQTDSQKYVSRLLDSKTLESRILIWQKSMQMSKDNLWFGVGAGNWQIQFPKYGLERFNVPEIINGEATLQRPHNDFIWILCEIGVFGLAAYLLIFVVIIYQLIILIQKSSVKEKWQFYTMLSGLLGYMLISFFDFPYERIEHQVLLMVLFAITTAAYLKTQPKTNQRLGLFFYIVLISVGYSFLVSLYRYNGEWHARKLYLAKAYKNWEETIYEAKKSDNYFYRLDNTTIPLSWYEGVAHFAQNRMEESENCFYKAYQLTPFNIQVINNLASTYQVNGKTEEAGKLYSNALQISPGFDEAKLNLAALYFNKKEYDKAYSLIHEIPVDSKNPKYQQYLIPILNNKVNTFLKTCTDKKLVDYLVKNIRTKETLLQLFFDAKKLGFSFEKNLRFAKF